MQDTPASWLLLFHVWGDTQGCAWCDQTEFIISPSHDPNVLRCLQAILGIEGAPDLVRMLSNFQCPEVVWGSVALQGPQWQPPPPTGQVGADCVHMIKQRHPEVAEMMLIGIDQEVAPCFPGGDKLCKGWSCPRGGSSPTHHQPGICRRSQQNPNLGGNSLEEQFLTTLWPSFTDAQKALLWSQRGPLASAALDRVTDQPGHPHRASAVQVVVVVVLSLFHLPLSSRTCRCGRRLDI